MHQTLDMRLDRLERTIRTLHQKVDSLLRAANLTMYLEIEQMADFTALNARVAKLTSVTESIKTMNDGLKVERDALKSEIESLKAADQIDQGAVDAAEASLATTNAVLDAIAAVASNTGGSTGGVTE